MELKGKKILFLGDSITEGVGASDVSNCFVSLIAKNEGAECVNYGIGGTRIARQLKPSMEPIWDRDYLSRVPEMDEDADVVVVNVSFSVSINIPTVGSSFPLSAKNFSKLFE